jgi:hypothetical protein
MISLWLIPFVIQGVVILLDEFWFHRKRKLSLWERVGHPIDTFFFIICLSFPFFAPFKAEALRVYILFACFSCLLITKDEWVHASSCLAQEHWLHSILFILHPILLIETLILWGILRADSLLSFYNFIGISFLSPKEAWFLLLVQWIEVMSFLIYQIIVGGIYEFYDQKKYGH